jgi:hypothetical protein
VIGVEVRREQPVDLGEPRPSRCRKDALRVAIVRRLVRGSTSSDSPPGATIRVAAPPSASIQ